MLQITEQLDLVFQGAQHRLLALLVRRGACGQLDLLDGHQETCRGVHSEVDLSKGTSTDESALDPLDSFLCASL